MSKSFDELCVEMNAKCWGISIEDAQRIHDAETDRLNKEINEWRAGEKWKVQIHGGAGDKSFEISVVNSHFVDRTQRHYGWFNENKLLISHNGGPCQWPVTQQVWDKLVRVAQQVADELNNQSSHAD